MNIESTSLAQGSVKPSLTVEKPCTSPPCACPFLTIGIPTYKRPALLAKALNSIRNQIGLSGVEVLVCDDGNLPLTRDVVAQCGIPRVRHIVNETRLGAVENWNQCLALSSGKWVTILHDDDVLYPWFFASIKSHLIEEVAAVAVRCDRGAEPPSNLRYQPSPGYAAYAAGWFLKSSPTPFPGMVFSRRIAGQIGGFDPRKGGLADYTFWYELALRGEVRRLQVTAAFYRTNQGQWTDQEWPSMLRKAHLLRLRIAAEQLSRFPRARRWIARFYTSRMARSYHRQYGNDQLVLKRSLRFKSIFGGKIPSGWVWLFLRLLVQLDTPFRLPSPLLRNTHVGEASLADHRSIESV